jgi:hypothetical protein
MVQSLSVLCCTATLAARRSTLAQCGWVKRQLRSVTRVTRVTRVRDSLYLLPVWELGNVGLYLLPVWELGNVGLYLLPVWELGKVGGT